MSGRLISRFRNCRFGPVEACRPAPSRTRRLRRRRIRPSRTKAGRAPSRSRRRGRRSTSRRRRSPGCPAPRSSTGRDGRRRFRHRPGAPPQARAATPNAIPWMSGRSHSSRVAGGASGRRGNSWGSGQTGSKRLDSSAASRLRCRQSLRSGSTGKPSGRPCHAGGAIDAAWSGSDGSRGLRDAAGMIGRSDPTGTSVDVPRRSP